ncbi:MAG: hypothetical protein KC586_14335 [Myxococcales bacterium]|nr:hypothetical protein [Myxococcales bacterium]
MSIAAVVRLSLGHFTCPRGVLRGERGDLVLVGGVLGHQHVRFDGGRRAVSEVTEQDVDPVIRGGPKVERGGRHPDIRPATPLTPQNRGKPTGVGFAVEHGRCLETDLKTTKVLSGAWRLFVA